MTTVAYKDGCIAADRQAQSGWMRFGEMTKIRRTRHGFLVGGAGHMARVQEFLDWAEEGLQPGHSTDAPTADDPDACAEGIIVHPDGRILIYDNSPRLVCVAAPFVAIGTGEKYAMAAMEMGASPAEAVALASRFDIYTGSVVDQVGFERTQSKTEPLADA